MTIRFNSNAGGDAWRLKQTSARPAAQSSSASLSERLSAFDKKLKFNDRFTVREDPPIGNEVDIPDEDVPL